jgi:hypothetical protein
LITQTTLPVSFKTSLTWQQGGMPVRMWIKIIDIFTKTKLFEKKIGKYQSTCPDRSKNDGPGFFQPVAGSEY